MKALFKPDDAIHYQGESFEYRLVHRPRVTRRVHLELAEDGGLLVVAPPGMSRRAVRRSLQQKAGRVARFVAVARSRQRDLPVLNYAEGEHHLYLGESLTLKVHATGSSRSKVTLDGSALVIETGNPQPAYLRDLLRRWYREQAVQDFTERLRIISAQAALRVALFPEGLWATGTPAGFAHLLAEATGLAPVAIGLTIGTLMLIAALAPAGGGR